MTTTTDPSPGRMRSRAAAVIGVGLVGVIVIGCSSAPSWDEEQRINREWEETCEVLVTHPDC